MEHFLIELGLRGAALCLLTALALLLLRRTAAAYRHRVCVPALGGLLILPFAQRLLPSLPLLAPSGAMALQRSPAATAQRSVLENTSPPTAAFSAPSEPTPSTLRPQSNAPAPSERAFLPPMAHAQRSSRTAALLGGLWGLGTTILLIRLTVALFRLRRLERDSRPTELGGVAVLVSERVETPLTWGIRRPLILLPTSLLSADPAVWESALHHEQAHIERRDWVWNLLAEGVCAFCWFHPGVWWLRRRLRLESERACDDQVLLTGLAGPDYAAHLLQILHSVRTQEIAPAMALCGSMEARMRHILDTKQPRRANRFALAMTAPVGIALLSLAALRLSARPMETRPATSRDAGAAHSPGANLTPPPAASTLPVELPGAPTMADLPDSGMLPTSIGGHSDPQALTPRASAPLQNNSPAATSLPNSSPTATPNAASGAALGPIVWGKAVDGLEPGFLRVAPDLPDGMHMPFNSPVVYQVLVRNTSRQERAVEVQCRDFHEMDPSWIPDADLQKALNGSKIPNDYRVTALTELVLAYVGYSVKLAPGEAVLLPEVLHLYVGNGDQQSFPRTQQVKPGKNWLVHPIMVRPLTSAEAAEDLASIASPYGNGIDLTILNRDGSTVKKRGAKQGIRQGNKKLYATIPLEITDIPAVNGQAENPLRWGETKGGFQLGARIKQATSVFHTGDTIHFEPVGRNLSGRDAQLTVGNYWKVNYEVQIQTQDGAPVYMERDKHNQAMLVAGYRGEPFGDGVTTEISEARLRIIRTPNPQPAVFIREDEDTWVEAVALKPGHYRVRLLSGGVFGRETNPASGWIPLEVKN